MGCPESDCPAAHFLRQSTLGDSPGSSSNPNGNSPAHTADGHGCRIACGRSAAYGITPANSYDRVDRGEPTNGHSDPGGDLPS
jgi:hypothetical protein